MTPASNQITNHDISPQLWAKMLNREQLRTLAKEQGIARGRDREVAAMNLFQGTPASPGGDRITFDIDLIMLTRLPA